VSALHITNGDCAAAKLRQFLDDPVILAADVLHDGPAPLVEDDAWYAIRSQFLGGSPDRASAIRDELAAADRQLDAASDEDEIVLWFEHDLFDQLNLIRTLDRIARRGRRRRPVRLICIDRFPGVDRFVGLGQLDPRQLSTLVAHKMAVTDAQLDLASRAWTAFRAPDPSALAQLAETRPPELPFLGDALVRFLAEYPSTTSGLSRTAQHALDVLAAGPHDAAVLFEQVQAREERPFMGDWGFFDVVRRLAVGRVALVRIALGGNARDLRGHAVSLTDTGLRVLRGEVDAIALNGIDEWRGGVHLRGANSSPWRWDPARQTLVSLNAPS
jgi:hypothetical protein